MLILFHSGLFDITIVVTIIVIISVSLNLSLVINSAVKQIAC